MFSLRVILQCDVNKFIVSFLILNSPVLLSYAKNVFDIIIIDGTQFLYKYIIYEWNIIGYSVFVSSSI
jgi:hypothetical protein